MTRRVSPLLVMSNTIFDVARRGKTLLVTPNTHHVQRGNDTTHRGNNTTNMATSQVPSPSLAQNARRRGYISFGFPPTSPPSPPSLKTQDGGDIFHLIFLQPVPHPLPHSKRETEDHCQQRLQLQLQPEQGRRARQTAAAAAANANEDDKSQWLAMQTTMPTTRYEQRQQAYEVRFRNKNLFILFFDYTHGTTAVAAANAANKDHLEMRDGWHSTDFALRLLFRGQYCNILFILF